MPRTGRVVSLTGYNHIIARGNGGICIFEDDEDRYRMLTLFEDKLVGNGIVVTAWCLMSNHFHLMVDDPNGRISSCMSGILTSYVKYFNHKTDRVGHLFQDRFKNIPVENDIQAIALADYIHMNPVKRVFRLSIIIAGPAIGHMRMVMMGLGFAILALCWISWADRLNIGIILMSD